MRYAGRCGVDGGDKASDADVLAVSSGVTIKNRRCVRGGHEVLLERLEHAVFEDDKENEEGYEDELDGDAVAAKMEIEKQLRQRLRP